MKLPKSYCCCFVPVLSGFETVKNGALALGIASGTSAKKAHPFPVVPYSKAPCSISDTVTLVDFANAALSLFFFFGFVWLSSRSPSPSLSLYIGALRKGLGRG